MQAVLGEELDDRDELPISLSVAFERLRSIKSFHFFLLGMASLGLALFSLPLFLNLFLEEELGLDAFERGLFSSATYVPAVVAIAVAGTTATACSARSPPGAVLLMGGLVAGFGVFVALALLMPNVVLVGIVLSIGLAMARAAVHRRLRHDGGGDPLPAALPGRGHGRRLPLLLRRVLRRRPHRRRSATPSAARPR